MCMKGLHLYLGGTPSQRTSTSPPCWLLLDNRLYISMNVVCAVTLGWMPWTYRMYPNIISSPPLHVPLLLHCKITFSKKIRFLLLTKYWESFLNMDQMEATFHYIPIFQKNQRTQTNCVCVCVCVWEREFPICVILSLYLSNRVISIDISNLERKKKEPCLKILSPFKHAIHLLSSWRDYKGLGTTQWLQEKNNCLS